MLRFLPRTATAVPTIQRPRSLALLANEQLIKKIQSRSPPPKNVRIVPDPLRRDEDDSKTQLVPLREAIELASYKDLDIVEISLQQETPVITLSNLSALQYQQKRKASSSRTKRTSPSSVLKEVTLKAAIAENDLRRKISDMERFLLKGHPVQISVQAYRRVLATRPDAVMETLTRVLDEMESRANVPFSVASAPRVTDPERKNLAKCTIQPGSDTTTKGGGKSKDT